ncbi:MAG: hypothetical protein AAGI38_10200 [Bacteroidota bacterium]
MKLPVHLLLFLTLMMCGEQAFPQRILEQYEPAKNDSLRIGTGDDDFLAFIQRGYTLMLPNEQPIKGVLIFLEDSGYDKKNRNAQQLYPQAAEAGFAVLSVSTEVPFDFYFTEASLASTHAQVQEAFSKHNLSNEHVFFLGASLVGHRAMKYIEYVRAGDHAFTPNIAGIVICNFTLDWTRKWRQHERDIRLNRIDLWEPRFMNYMLETHLGGTPRTTPEKYHEFSSYSYFDPTNRNIDTYKNYAVRAYTEPAIKYRLKKYHRTLYENNATDIVGFLAELSLAGNDNTELIVIQPEDNPSPKKNAQATWDAIDKDELMEWILRQTER